MNNDNLTPYQKELLTAIRKWRYDSIESLDMTLKQNMEAEEKAFSHLKSLLTRALDSNLVVKEMNEIGRLDNNIYLKALHAACNHIEYLGNKLRDLKKEDCHLQVSPEYWINIDKAGWE